ncbi:hypothetical protein [Rhabdaerophilum sp. SD176]|uniref:hypothetical protein n=1 Tax=Rhabdaerophilum sp. SD176 TaxID=2983548 RepID=UPI0024DFC3BA|nr:hypothetical protein [Rhabdaerophilum sp. SD176]
MDQPELPEPAFTHPAPHDTPPPAGFPGADTAFGADSPGIRRFDCILDEVAPHATHA